MDQTGMEPIITYIETHLSEELDNRLLASLSGYSESHFIRLFRRVIGLSPADYIRKRRITEIVRTIGHESRPMSDVAFSFGFNSKENFTRAFKTEHGILPTQWKTADCSLRLFEPFSFHSATPAPQVALRYLSPFTLITYDFGEAFPPSCWNLYNAEGRSRTLSGGITVADYGAMRRTPDGKRLSYAIGIPETDARGDLRNTRKIVVEGGLYALFETQAADTLSFVATIRRTWDWIMTSWLPANGYVRREGYELESYVESSRLYSETIYIPIRKEKTMAEIIKVFREEIPTLKFIGKKYENFGHWGEWWEHGWFDLLESTMGGTDAILALWENGGGYLGLERRVEGEPFAYYIGMLTPANTPVPEGFEAILFEGVALGTVWIYGSEDAVHDTSAARGRITDAGMKIWQDKDGAVWSFENCLCPRFTTPDETGNIILDYCYFIEK